MIYANEQKDPLLIYKFEAFQLFKKTLLEANQNIVSFLTRAGIPLPDEQQQEQEGRRPAPQQIAQEVNYEEMYDNEDAVKRAGQDFAADEQDYYTEPTYDIPGKPSTVTKNNTVGKFEEPKIGRNELCPCGSGKKFKQCHGANS